MKSNWLYGLIFIAPIVLIIVASIYTYNKDMFMGLKPKAIYEEYKIYDIVEQKGLACAEAVEYLGSDGMFDYYFPCLKSATIYFVKDGDVINVHEAYEKGIINLQKLYELDIVDRMVSLGGQ